MHSDLKGLGETGLNALKAGDSVLVVGPSFGPTWSRVPGRTYELAKFVKTTPKRTRFTFMTESGTELVVTQRCVPVGDSSAYGSHVFEDTEAAREVALQSQQLRHGYNVLAQPTNLAKLDAQETVLLFTKVAMLDLPLAQSMLARDGQRKSAETLLLSSESRQVMREVGKLFMHLMRTRKAAA